MSIIRELVADGIGVTYVNILTGEMSIAYFPESEEEGLNTGRISVLKDDLNKFPGFPEIGAVFKELDHAIELLNIYLTQPKSGEKEKIAIRNLVRQGYRQDACEWLLL